MVVYSFSFIHIDKHIKNLDMHIPTLDSREWMTVGIMPAGSDAGSGKGAQANQDG